MGAVSLSRDPSRGTGGGLNGAPVVRRNSPLRIVGMILGYAVMVVVSVFVVMPFIWMVLSSLKNNNEIYMVPVKWLPDTWHFEHYAQIWQKADMLGWLGNTVFFAVAVTFLQVFTGSFAAYGWSIILLQAFGAFGVFMMKQFYDTIPDELSEAARLDGLSEFGIYLRVILPLSGSSVAALAIITFTNTWNDYMGPLLYLRSPDLYTIQLGLKTFISQYDADYSMIMTGSVLSVLPILVVFLIGQKQFIEGIATSGMKG